MTYFVESETPQKSAHRIRHLSCETDYKYFADNDDLGALKAEMDSFLQSALPKLLQQTFERYDKPSQVYSIKQLNINIPLKYQGDKRDLKQRLLENCRQQLEVALAKFTSETNTNALVSSQLNQTTHSSFFYPVISNRRATDKASLEKEAVLFYLQYGFLNWKYQPYKLNLARILNQAIQKGELLPQIQALMGQNRALLPRLMQMLNPQNDSFIFSWVSPSQGDELYGFWCEMQNKLQHDASEVVQSPAVSEGSELFASIGADTNIPSLMRLVMFNAFFTIEHQRLTTSQLLGRLIAMLAETLALEQPLVWQWLQVGFLAPNKRVNPAHNRGNEIDANSSESNVVDSSAQQDRSRTINNEHKQNKEDTNSTVSTTKTATIIEDAQQQALNKRFKEKRESQKTLHEQGEYRFNQPDDASDASDANISNDNNDSILVADAASLEETSNATKPLKSLVDSDEYKAENQGLSALNTLKHHELIHHEQSNGSKQIEPNILSDISVPAKQPIKGQAKTQQASSQEQTNLKPQHQKNTQKDEQQEGSNKQNPGEPYEDGLSQEARPNEIFGSETDTDNNYQNSLNNTKNTEKLGFSPPSEKVKKNVSEGFINEMAHMINTHAQSKTFYLDANISIGSKLDETALLTNAQVEQVQQISTIENHEKLSSQESTPVDKSEFNAPPESQGMIEIHSLSELIHQLDNWLLQPVEIIEKQLYEIIKTSSQIKLFSQSLGRSQLVNLVSRLREADGSQLIHMAVIVVDLLMDAKKQREPNANFKQAKAHQLLQEKSKRQQLLNYLVLSFWLMPKKPLSYPDSLFSACQFLSNQLSYALSSDEYELNQARERAANFSSQKSQNPNHTKSGEHSSDSLAKDVAMQQQEQPLTQTQQRIWKQRLLTAIARWQQPQASSITNRPQTASSESLNEASVKHLSEQQNSNAPNSSYRLLSEFSHGDNSLLQRLKAICLAKTPNPSLNSNPLNERLDGSVDTKASKSQESQIQEENPSSLILDEPIWVENAGLVLVSVYLERLFHAFKWIQDNSFINDKTATKAVMLLSYMATGKTATSEVELSLNKVLCGLPLETYINTSIELSVEQYQTADSLLEAVIGHWGALGSTSIDGLRESFLLRNGWLEKEENGWLLRIESKPFDMLLDQLPWSFSIIKHAWMELPISTQWRDKS